MGETLLFIEGRCLLNPKNATLDNPKNVVLEKESMTSGNLLEERKLSTHGRPSGKLPFSTNYSTKKVTLGH